MPANIKAIRHNSGGETTQEALLEFPPGSWLTKLFEQAPSLVEVKLTFTQHDGVTYRRITP